MLPSSEEHWAAFSEPQQFDTENVTPKPTQDSSDSASSSTTLVSNTSSLGKRKREASPDGYLSRKPRIASDDRILDKEQGLEQPYIIPPDLPLSWSGWLRKWEWGVAWEVARLGASRAIDLRGSIEIETLNNLEGTNKKIGPFVRQIVLKQPEAKNEFSSRFNAEIEAKSPWRHLDEEEIFLQQTETGGTGCISDDPQLQITDEPYGGLVEFVAKLSYDEEKFKITLLPPQTCPSTRLSRRFGSKQFFRLRINKGVQSGRHNAELMSFLQRPVVIMKRVFRAFTAKDSSVFFVQTYEEDHNGSVITQHGKRGPGDPMPFLEFINWNNPLECNNHQTIAKWASRFALGLSNSVPGIKLMPQNIFYIPDINSANFSGGSKVPSEQIMTDGCGFTNKAMMRLLRNRIGWDESPTAIQCRIAGAKGLLLLHPSDDENESPEPKVWIRESQKKICFPKEPNDDPAMLTVDVLRASHMSSPARLSPETIINLAENGVPKEIFVHLFDESLRQSLHELTFWSDNEYLAADGVSTTLEARTELWANVARAGSVLLARRARLNASSARAKGLVYETYTDDHEDEEDRVDNDAQPSTAWIGISDRWPDAVSGQPSSLEETVMYLLDSGFDPRHLWVLREKLMSVISRVGDSYKKRSKIPVLYSCSGFIVPDPCNVLEEGEIQVKSSHNFRFADGWERSTVLGEVLVTRHPCKLPSDVQKVRAVERPELRDYTDVIVFSTKGKRSLASLLAGGDYDGDKVEVYWDPKLVQAFNPPSQTYADEPPDLHLSFSQHNETVDSFLARSSSMEEQEMISQLQLILLAHVKNDGKYIGIYNDFYIKSMYSNGYFHPETITLAYKFTTILDGTKNGKTITNEAYQQDRLKYPGRKPEWNETEEERGKADQGNNKYPKRRCPGLFIMDSLRWKIDAVVKMKVGEIKDMIHKMKDKHDDEDLFAPYKEILAWIADRCQDPSKSSVAEMMKQDVKMITDHVDSIHQQWIMKVNRRCDPFTSLRIEDRQDRLRKLSQEFAQSPLRNSFQLLLFDTAHLIKASYAYTKGGRKSRFPWDMCMRDLCQLKSSKTPGSFKPVMNDFYYRFRLHEGSTQRRRH